MNKRIFAFRDDTKSKEAEEFVRTNGFTLPLQIFQLMSFFIFIIIVALIIIISAFNTDTIFLLFYIFFGVLIIIIIALSYTVTTINPVDPLSFKYIHNKVNEEDLKDLCECDICGFVEPQSKHCKFYGGYDDALFYILLCSLFVLNGTVFVLVIQLFGLHIFLISKKMTTYEYIVKRSHSEEEQKIGIKTFFEWLIIDKKRLKKSDSDNQDLENQEIERVKSIKD
ncbi:palmitoyltransferase DHHC3 [Plasmodium brasilianum]|uniref:Palmitoyltransferase DHHC3 n=1 Tax=Plasmodium brasilianum TaxID=5824 RepID=A0ACB9YAD7_PLABR|nr:palmitoyltransferase DHHC3 [Plasmodium brasilianum]